MAARKPADTKPPTWLGKPLVACVDGPMINQWFFVPDWEGRLTAARHMLDRDQPRSPVLDYVEDATIPHPQWGDAAPGRAMYYRPRRKP